MALTEKLSDAASEQTPTATPTLDTQSWDGTYVGYDGVPKSALIASLKLQAKRQREETLARYTKIFDLPQIQSDIEHNNAEAQKNQDWFDNLLVNLRKAPPAMATTVQPQEGESIAGLVDFFMGDPLAAKRTYDVAAGRQSKEFSNEVNAYQAGHEADLTAAERAAHLADQATAQAEHGKDLLAHGKSDIAGLDAQLSEGEGQLNEKLGLTELQDIYNQMEEKRRVANEVQLAGYKATMEAQLQTIARLDKDRALRIENTLKGLEKLQEDPDTPESVVDNALAGLAKDGFQMPEGAADVYKNIAHGNFHHNQFEEQMRSLSVNSQVAQTNQGRIRTNIDAAKEGLVISPDGSVKPVEPSFPGGAVNFDTGRPNAGKGEADVQQLGVQIGTLGKAKGALAEAKRQVEAKVTAMAPERRAKGREVWEAEYKIPDLQAKVDQAETNTVAARAAVLANSSPQHIAWMRGMFDKVTGTIKAVTSGQLKTVDLPDIGTLDVAQLTPKGVADKLREWYRATTGFSIDDKRMLSKLGITGGGGSSLGKGAPAGARQIR